jgi:hypothetical protein
MARDAEQKFYYHNQLLLRFLIASTLVFLIVLTLVWWQGRNDVQSTTDTLPTIVHFSQVAAMAEVTKAYAFGARYIHDIEAYPKIKSRFFTDDTLGFNNRKDLKKALDEVGRAHRELEESMKSHVYHTSYYVGNLLVLPGKTLHEVLLEGRPNTSVLLEAALADVRAGAIKIGEYYDVAPPAAYNTTFAEAVYYPAPSAPSLTVSEAAIVLYLLAEVDNGHARIYEQQLIDYAGQALAAGAHFAPDIQAAIDLAEIYHKIMIDTPAYQELIDRAKDEWEIVPADDVEREEPLASVRFSVKGFPYREKFLIDKIFNDGYAPFRDETLAGEVRLTLRDTRIPDAVSLLYGVNLEQGIVLPIDLSVQRQQYDFLLDSLEHASYNGRSEYIAVSQNNDAGALVARQGSTVRKMEGLELESPVTSVDARYDLGRLVVTDYNPVSQNKRTTFAKFSGLSLETLAVVEQVADSVIFDKERFLALEAGEVVVVNSAGGSRQKVEGVEARPVMGSDSNRRLWNFHELDLMVTADSGIEPTSLIPETEITLYAVRAGEGEVVRVEPVYSVSFGDTLVSDLVMSPSGRYIAMVATDSLGTRESKLLLFDTLNGIIKKEIDLTDFSPGAVSLDAWLNL